MPGTTAAPLLLPYPVAADPNDVPADILALANRLALILAPGGAIDVGPQLRDYSELRNANAAATGAVTLDIAANGNVHHLTLTGAVTLTFANPSPAGTLCALTILLTQDATGSRAVTWPASVRWAGGTTPTLTTTASRTDVITFITVDGGNRWLGFVGGLNYNLA